MADVVTVRSDTLSQILVRLKALQKDVRSIGKKVEDLEPVYGSDAWWQWSDKGAVESIERGDYYELKNKKELDSFLDNIKLNRSNEKYHRNVRQKS